MENNNELKNVENINTNNTQSNKSQKKSNSTKKVILGVACVAVVGGIISGIVLNKDKLFNSSTNNTNTVSNVTENNNTIQAESSVENLKKYLKDSNWVKSNLMMSETWDGNFLKGEQKLYFMPLKDSNKVIVEAYSEADTSFQFWLVGYENNTIKVVPITTTPTWSEQTYITIDPNNQIISYDMVRAGDEYLTFYKISNMDLIVLDELKYLTNPSMITDMERADDYCEIWINGEVGTIEEFEEISKKYNVKTFSSPSIELTSENIDTLLN